MNSSAGVTSRKVDQDICAATDQVGLASALGWAAKLIRGPPAANVMVAGSPPSGQSFPAFLAGAF